ncbi:MAG TPA: hypothetical protein VEQ42_00010, partial [Pyrinomonadaceae bacterium]|nr:hypothetical protein [Pyrinomonadaceae bacterium]
MRPTVLPPALARFVSFLLAYSLLVTLLGALPTRRAVASSEVKAPVEKVAGTRAAARPRAQAARRDNELLVRFREGVGEQEQNALLSSKGARRKAKLRGRSRLEKLELQAGQDPSAVAAELSRQPSVEFAEPNFVITRSQVAPDDARFAEQWALRNVGQTGGQSGADIASPAAWASSVGGAATVIAVADSGVDFTHPDLAGNRWTNGRERDNRRDDDRNGFADDLYGWDWVTNSG